MEIAFVSSDLLRIEVERKKGLFSARIISRFVNKPSKYIATMLLGNNAALVIYGLIMAKIMEPQIKTIIASDFWVLIIQTFLSTLLILIAAEFIPKTIFRLNPNKALNFFAVPVWIIYWILFPLTAFTIFVSDFVLKTFFKTNNDEQTNTNVFGKVDLNNFIEQSAENSEEIEDELKIIQNTLDFDKIKLKECIIPRNEIVAISIHETIAELAKKITETGYSKIPIFDGSIDNIIGYAHVHGLYKQPKQIKDIMVDIPIVPETMTAQKLFNILIRKKRSMALVVDEYGGTSGIVTIEDILEEIFGEIEDEHDVTDFVAEKINETTYEFSGRVEIDFINEKFDLNIQKSEDYETLAGFILNNLERFPEKGEKFTIDSFLITVLEVEHPKIERIRLEINNEK
jgi:CBS domain containing-hemolysin-like protein